MGTLLAGSVVLCIVALAAYSVYTGNKDGACRGCSRRGACGRQEKP